MIDPDTQATIPPPPRVALVTGAARGIGRACALRLARAGCTVGLVDRRVDALADLVTQIERAGGHGAALPADLAVTEQIAGLVARCHDTLGAIDVLVHCAGVILPKGLAAATVEDWDAMMAVNLRAVFLLSRAALPDLRSRRGTIITIASTAGLHPQYLNGPYCVAKAGVVMLSRALAQELRSNGVRVNCVCPGGVDTPLMEEYVQARGDTRGLDRLRASGLLSQPDEIADAVLWLAGDGARAVTGQVLAVDRGALLTP